ncbi:bacteriocin immunity protein [Sutcliffiella horikoshii]|uniref:bacteriocin immunity protein n=1 Tax=Sutcliffiella horikoshii TaxID=79883 RepID=UPI001EEE6EAB|nr:bacteriocin immunity protein [Sutcliffiella horikoshii]MCG1021434.1 hypothetical protein [Sutcliffiella horikoshii]
MKLTKEELVILVQKILKADGSEEELDNMIDTVEQNVPHSNVSDLIFWNEEGLSAEEIVNRTLNDQSKIF